MATTIVSEHTFDLTDPSHPIIKKVQSANLDYSWDWSAYCTRIGENISSYQITVSPGMTFSNATKVGNKITVFVAGGIVGKEGWATCRAVFASGRVAYKTMFFKILAR